MCACTDFTLVKRSVGSTWRTDFNLFVYVCDGPCSALYRWLLNVSVLNSPVTQFNISHEIYFLTMQKLEICHYYHIKVLPLCPSSYGLTRLFSSILSRREYVCNILCKFNSMIQFKSVWTLSPCSLVIFSWYTVCTWYPVYTATYWSEMVNIDQEWGCWSVDDQVWEDMIYKSLSCDDLILWRSMIYTWDLMRHCHGNM